MHRLYLHIEPLTGPQSPSGVYLVVWPEANGNGRWCHHSHPDRMVLDAQAGDSLVHKRQPYRVLAAQRLAGAVVVRRCVAVLEMSVGFTNIR